MRIAPLARTLRRAASAWLVLLAGAQSLAPALAAQDTTSSAAKLVRYEIKPSAIDPSVRDFDEPHYVVFERGVKADAPLLLFLPGTGGRPLNTSLFANVAAEQGYRVIGLEYVDEPAVQQICPRDPDPSCAEKVRRKRIFGEDATSLINDPADQSIVARLTKVLVALDRDHSEDGWSRYLKNGHPDWTQIAVSGLSQGAGMAAYIAQRTPVARVVLFSSPWDNYGRFHTLAPWVKRGNGATPSDRWYAAYHQKELTADIIPHAYAALKIPESHVHVFTLEPARRTSGNPYHPSGVGNGATPRKADGTPAYADEWRAMLGDMR
ncbi:MAG: BPSS1187 family protein [Gemmatimonadales bacterium]